MTRFNHTNKIEFVCKKIIHYNNICSMYFFVAERSFCRLCTENERYPVLHVFDKQYFTLSDGIMYLVGDLYKFDGTL